MKLMSDPAEDIAGLRLGRCSRVDSDHGKGGKSVKKAEA